MYYDEEGVAWLTREEQAEELAKLRAEAAARGSDYDREFSEFLAKISKMFAQS